MREPGQQTSKKIDGIPAALVADIDRAGFYPMVVADVLVMTLAGEPVSAHLVHLETTFDADDEVRRHVTVLAITPTRLVIVHADDRNDAPEAAADGPIIVTEGAAAQLTAAGRTYAAVSADAVPLSSVHAVSTMHVIDRPDRYRPGGVPREITIGFAWGVASRIDLEPATCGDPDCDGDHGYTGTLTGDDLALRVSSDAEGATAVEAALAFARSLSAATAALA